MGYLRPSRDCIIGDFKESGTVSASLSGVGTRSDGREETAGRKVERTRAGSGVEALFPLAPSYLVCGGRASAGVSEAHRHLRHDWGRTGQVKEGK